MKLLLYCAKAKPYLVKRNIFAGVEPSYFILKEKAEDRLNGKIVAECDFEVEEIVCDGYAYLPLNSNPAELEIKGCLTEQELENYFTKKYGLVGYAIHIKNLNIFDEPRELNHYMVYDKSYDNMFGWEFDEENKYNPLTKAPQNMMYAYDGEEKKVLISIRPEWLCKILNSEKTIEVRKKVLKEMLG